MSSINEIIVSANGQNKDDIIEFISNSLGVSKSIIKLKTNDQEVLKKLPKIKKHTTTIITSKRNTGKTVIALNLIKDMLITHDYNYICLFSDTANFNPQWDFIKKDLIFSLESDKLEKIMEYQKEKIEKSKNKKDDEIVSGLIIVDDVQLNKKNKILENLFTMGRHYKLTIIVTCQYCKHLISPILRNNIDYLMIGDVTSESLKTLYDCMSVSISFKDFKDYVKSNVYDNRFILYNNTTKMGESERLSVTKGKFPISFSILNVNRNSS